MEQIWEGEEEEEQFELRQIVWAKIIGYPWWPAKITQIPTKKIPHYRVDFFSDNTHAFLPPSKLCKYSDMRSHFDVHRNMNKGLRKAVVSADRSLGEQRVYQGSRRPSLSSVEGQFSPLKQLLKSPQATTPLQENNKLQSIAQPQEDSQQSQSQAQVSEEVNSSLPKYSYQQRKTYVNNLLKKYRLLNIPKLPQVSHSPSKISERQYNPSKRRTAQKKVQTKTKNIKKLPYQQQNYLFLLSRKIHSLLRDKGGLNNTKKKEISSSLAKGVLGGGGIQEVGGVLKWIMISPSETIANYYQNWGCLQGEKQKNSSMTNEE